MILAAEHEAVSIRNRKFCRLKQRGRVMGKRRSKERERTIKKEKEIPSKTIPIIFDLRGKKKS